MRWRGEFFRSHAAAGRRTRRSRVKVVDGGTRLSAARTDECRPSRKEKIVYIGLGTIVIIIVIVVVVMMLRR